MTDGILKYFAQAGPTTELGGYADLIRELPSDPKVLARVVRGLVIHQGLVAPAGLDLPPERFTDRERVGAAPILQRVLELDPSPLTSERPPRLRMVGYCYHFAVLHCAFLRAKGVPSRARCGFAAYYREGAWIDHWVVEYWDDGGWVLIDPDSARDVVSPDDFHHAGLAWQLCRAGNEDPSLHGNHELWGWDELRGSLIADFGSLNKVEVGDWETWCEWIAIERKEQPNAELDPYLDSLAPLVTHDDRFDELQRVFREDDRLRPPSQSLTAQHQQLRYEEPSLADIEHLEDRLYEFNTAETGITDGRSLGVFLRDPTQKIVAGAAGHTWGDTCELRQVWVAEPLRRRGLGRRLLAKAEAEAVRRGCAQIILTTHSFQAPDFYARLGFVPISEIPDYPRGHSQVVLRKALAARTASDEPR